MDGIRKFTSSVKPYQGSRTTGASNERVASQPTHPPAKAGLPPLGPGLQRVDSNPARLPSNTPERPEAKPIQGISEGPFRPGKLSRTEPDIFPPMHFGRSPATKFWGIPLPFSKSSTIEGSKLKAAFLEKKSLPFQDIEKIIKDSHPDLMEIVKELSPKYDRLSDNLRRIDMKDALKGHPKYEDIKFEYQNKNARLTTFATATRTMTEVEHKFLAKAMQRIQEDVERKPFHMHGESAITGDKKGKITDFHHEPRGGVDITLKARDKYYLHNHRPFNEPATSIASLPDHIAAAETYFMGNRKALSYVTNGKDVLHIQPDSTELVKMLPNPEMVKKMGEFPVAFTTPKPAPRPNPFTNHEAPGPQ